MSNHSIVEHRASYYFIRIEEDFLAICSKGKCSPHCKALILAILEHWINTKRAKGEGNYVYLTIPQWIKHTYMLYERNVIIDCLKELLEEGLIERRPFKIYNQDTFEYTLSVDAIHEQVKALPSKPDKETMPNLDAYLGYKAKAKKARDEEKAKKKEAIEKSTAPVEKSTTVGDKSTGVVEKSTQQRIRTQTPNLNSNIDSERTNDEPDNIATPETSFTHSSNPSLSSSKVIFTEEEAQVLTIAKKLKLSFLSENEKNKAHCSKLVLEGVITLEQMKSLMQFCKQRPYLKGKDINLGNLAGELDGWLQLQQQTATEQPQASFLASDETSDQNLEKLQARIAARQQKEKVTS